MKGTKTELRLVWCPNDNRRAFEVLGKMHLFDTCPNPGPFSAALNKARKHLPVKILEGGAGLVIAAHYILKFTTHQALVSA